MKRMAFLAVLLVAPAVAQDYRCMDDRGEYWSTTECPDGEIHPDRLGPKAPAADSGDGGGSAGIDVSKSPCLADFSCWEERYRHDARIACSIRIERTAKYDFKWTDGLFGRKFPDIFRGPEPQILALSGDSIELKNGFGNWIPHRYTCQYDPNRERVISLDVNPGRW